MKSQETIRNFNNRWFALKSLVPTAQYTLFEDGSIQWDSKDISQPSEEEINIKIQELEAAEPMRLLRKERNRRLVETDWWAGKDVTMSQARKDYRQALRDLPSTASPTLDAEGNLTNVTWPIKPT